MRQILASFAVTIFLTAPLCALTTGPSKADEEFIGKLADVDSASRGIWPGYSPFFPGTPVLIETHGPALQILFGHASPPPGFNPLASEAGKFSGGKTIYFSTCAETGLDSTWTILKINGVKTQAYAFSNRDISLLELTLFVHENFHAFQKMEFAEINDTKVKVKSPAMTPELMADAYLERLILQRALISDHNEGFTRDFVTLRSARYKSNKDKTATAFERYYERLEGLAKYVDANISASKLSGGERGGLVSGMLSTQLVQSDIADYKFHFYGTGAVQGVLLDKLLPGWKESIKSSSSLFDLLKKAVKYSDEDEQEQVRKIHARYNYKGFLKLSKRNLRDFENIRDKYLQKMSAPESYILSFKFKSDELTSERMSHRGTFRVSDTAYIYGNIEDTRLESEKFRLKISQAPYLKIDFPDTEEISLDVPLGPSGTGKVLADGKDISEISGVRRVERFSAVSEGIRFELKVPAVIEVRGYIVRITLIK